MNIELSANLVKNAIEGDCNSAKCVKHYDNSTILAILNYFNMDCITIVKILAYFKIDKLGGFYNYLINEYSYEVSKTTVDSEKVTFYKLIDILLD